MDRLRTSWEFLRTSFWFVPSLMGLGAVTLAAGTVMLERSLGAATVDPAWFLYEGHPEDARSVLATLLSSMITMAALVFSITMVVLTLAASQFGPRLVRSFMAQPQTQVVLGTFVMTTVYCLLMLLATEVRDSPARVPHASVSIAAALTMVSLGLLVSFLHSLARSIVSETVIDRVADELDEWLGGLPPLDVEAPPAPPTERALPDDYAQRVVYFGTRAAGYVQLIEFRQLVAAASRAGVIVVLYFRAGHYVVPGAPEIGVYPSDHVTDALRTTVQGHVLVGAHRTPTQAPDFAIRHLDEIAVRALSAAINDPYTAVSVIDRLSGSLCTLMSRALPPGVWTDEQGVARVFCTAATHAGLIGEAFNQIRQHGGHVPIVAMHLLESIQRIAQHVRLPEQRTALERQAEATIEAGRRVPSALDRHGIEERYAAARRALDETAIPSSA